jgi:quinolinate synthase
MTISLQDLLVLGQGRDLASERGVSCTGEPHLGNILNHGP